MLDRRGGARASIHGNESLFFSRAPSGRDPGQCKNKTEVPSQARRQHARTRARGRTNQLVRDSTREADWSRPTPAPHRIQTHRLLSPLATCNDAEPCPGLRPMIPIPAGPLPACAALTTKLWSEACDPIRAARRARRDPARDGRASKRPLVESDENDAGSTAKANPSSSTRSSPVRAPHIFRLTGDRLLARSCDVSRRKEGPEDFRSFFFLCLWKKKSQLLVVLVPGVPFPLSKHACLSCPHGQIEEAAACLCRTCREGTRSTHAYGGSHTILRFPVGHCSP